MLVRNFFCHRVCHAGDVPVHRHRLSAAEIPAGTGKYRLGTPEWDSSYTCVSDDYVDVFRVEVQYQVAAGGADNLVLDEGQEIRGGWLSDENAVLYIAVFHDGSVVTKRISAWGDRNYFGAEFAEEVLR